MTYDEVRSAVLVCLSSKLTKAGLDASSVSDDIDLLQQGIIDSLGYISLIDELEERLGVAIDLAALDEDGMTTLGGLSRQITAIGK